MIPNGVFVVIHREKLQCIRTGATQHIFFTLNSGSGERNVLSSPRYRKCHHLIYIRVVQCTRMYDYNEM